MSRKIPAVFMRGGTSKGVFFHERDLPVSLSQREALLLRVIGSPDESARHFDGMGGGTSSTSKVVIIRPSQRSDCDVDFIFGAVSVEHANIDWSSNCGNLTAAVGPFAVQEGLIKVTDPNVDSVLVRMWQVNLGKRIDAHVPLRQAEVLESGNFNEDGVPFSSAEIRLEFIQPADDDALLILGDKAQKLLPTGNSKDILTVPGLGKFEVSLINAGDPTAFIRAESLGLTGRELPEQINKNVKLQEKLELVRAHAAVVMGLAINARDASLNRHGTPKLVWLAKPQSYVASNGIQVSADEIDILARIVSAGKLHPAFTDTGSIALGVAAALPGTIANQIARTLPGIPTRIGHVSGCLTVGAEVTQTAEGLWVLEKALLSHSARRLMGGWVYLPG